MADQKKATRATLLARGGGFALAFPVVIILGYFLVLLNLVMIAIIIATIFNIGGLSAIVGNVLPALIATFALGMAGLFGLIFATVRYMGGLRQLWQRLRGIQVEKQRMDDMLENAAANRLMLEETETQVGYSEGEQKRQSSL